jgi:cellulose synthase operon protein C
MSDELHALTAQYFDGELDGAQEQRALDHLASCAQCQRELGDLMGFEVALQRRPVAAVVASPVAAIPSLDHERARRAGRSRWLAPVAFTAALAAVAALILLLRGGRPGDPPSLGLALAPSRGVEARFSAPLFDRHRSYSVSRGSAGRETFSLAVLAELERRGDRASLAAAQASSGELEQARKVLLAEPASPVRQADLAAIELLAGRHELALEAADKAIAAAPDLASAHWNRALALRELGLTLTAASALERVASRAEPGWAQEAADKAAALRASMAGRGPRAQAFTAAARAMVDRSGPPLGDDQVADRPGLSRLYFHDALRAAGSREQALALLALADALDRQAGNALARQAVERVAQADFRVRAPLSLAYRDLALGRAPPDGGPALLARLDVTRGPVDDLRLGTLLFLDRNAARSTQLARLVAASADPWFLLILPRERARAALGAGEADRAETELRTALQGCDGRRWAYRCAQIAFDLYSLFQNATRYADAAASAETAVTLYRASGATESEDSLLINLAEMQRGRGRFALATATFHEAIARLGDQNCLGTRFATSGLVLTAVLLGADTLTVTPTAPDACGVPPQALEVAAMVDLARMTERESDRARAQLWIAAARAANDAQLTIAAELSEARLLISRQPVAANRLRAQLGALEGQDETSTALRAWTYQTLVDAAAQRSAWIEVVQRVAEEMAITPPANCVLVASIDDTRGTAVAIGRDSVAVGVHSSVAAPVQWTGAALVPASVRHALDGCAQIAVIARPPLHGRADLLGPEMPWAFVGTTRAPIPPTTASRELFVGDALPPAALALPALAPMPPRNPAVELRGAAATPARVLEALGTATYAELHVHGEVDLGVADASFLALTPGGDQRWALTAGEVRGAKLTSAPVIVLAACRAGAVAPFGHKRWSLPDAFLQAGARAVIAPTVEIPDDQANAFFTELRQRLGAGQAPAAALAEVRQSYVARGASWAAFIVLFN